MKFEILKLRRERERERERKVLTKFSPFTEKRERERERKTGRGYVEHDDWH